MLSLSTLAVVITLLIGIPVLWFSIQVMYACLPRKTPIIADMDMRGDVAVLIPAHNESVNLLPTLHAVLAERWESMRILLVADNCTDDTAEIARHAGVEVIERNNPNLRGKGYALDFGIQHLKTSPPRVVIVLDADCIPEKGALRTLANLALLMLRPIQGLTLMNNSHSPSLKAKIAAFAWLVKNRVRPRGMHRLGLPCQLTGTGMAFPWEVLQQISLATGDIVEDMKLGMALTTAGHAPLFSEHTVINSKFPNNEEGVQSQRLRWEHGHLSILLNEGLPNVLKGAVNRDMPLLFLALDLCIPPLALLLMGVFVWEFIAGLFWAASGNALPFTLGFVYLVLIASSVGLAWFKFGRHLVSGWELLMAPVYVLSKLPVYAKFLLRRQTQWVRAKRDNETK